LVADPEELARMLAEMQAEYRLALPMKLAEIEDLWRGAVAGKATAVKFEELSRLAHPIAGSAGTFGLMAVSAAARALEVALAPLCGHEAATTPGDVDRIGSLIEALKQSTGKC
jgi:HPt (histidine-containing phosphotransfer) domain-containing protein